MYQYTSRHTCFRPRLLTFILTILILSISLFSCVPIRQSVYFKNLQKDTTISGFVTNDFESKIQVGDQLSIIATSLSSTEDEQFNKAAALSSSPTMSGFNVAADGTVLLHQLGKYPVAGLTRKELAAQLQKDLLPYMKDPVVNVNYNNHKITVMGAVGAPQVIQMPEEQLSLLDVLVKSGGITETGLKDNVVVIREQGSTKKVKLVNLEDNSILTSPWYYVQPNDIVIVRGDVKKLQTAERKAQIQSNISLGTSILSVILVVYTLIRR